MSANEVSKRPEELVREKFPNAFADDDEEERVVIYSCISRGSQEKMFLGAGDCHFRAWANALAHIKLNSEQPAA